MVARKIVGSLHVLHDRLRYRAKREQQAHSEQNDPISLFPSAPFPPAFFKPQEPNVAVDANFRIFATSVFNVLKRYSQKPSVNNLTFAQRRGLHELRDLCAEGRIKVSVSDKGGEFVVITRGLDMDITRYHLSDTTRCIPRPRAKSSGDSTAVSIESG